MRKENSEIPTTTYSLGQWFSPRDDFAPSLFPGPFGNVWRQFWLLYLGRCSGL